LGSSTLIGGSLYTRPAERLPVVGKTLCGWKTLACPTPPGVNTTLIGKPIGARKASLSSLRLLRRSAQSYVAATSEVLDLQNCRM
jgi:hypothetical protein